MKLPHPKQTDLPLSPKRETRQGNVFERRRSFIIYYDSSTAIYDPSTARAKAAQRRPGSYWTRSLLTFIGIHHANETRMVLSH
nr:hypothetical protein Q903MT_gene1061 [Picea sitchensis]